MPTQSIAPGPTSVRVAEAVKALRLARGMTQTDLARAMTHAGRKAIKTSINKIESSERRVDADDLMALAVALDVSPLRLLLPVEAPSKQAQVTETARARVREVWAWARGERPLNGKADPARVEAFTRENQPDQPPLGLIEALQYADDLRRVAEAVAALERKGVSRVSVLATLEFVGTVPATEEGSH
jgi:transcriptional regulator with XRE-family HTH domain